ncbi:MAG: MazG-like family protein [Pseudomonadota bacterium]
MGYPSYRPTFSGFSERNRERCEAECGFNHQLDSWSLSDWAVAMAGEAGEACNVVKKLNRIRDGVDNSETPEDLREMLKAEIGDVFTYLDLMAQAAGFDLYSDCIAPKFNDVSERIGCPITVRVT